MNCPNKGESWCNTFGGYTNHACRLPPCRNKAREAKNKHRRLAAQRKWENATDSTRPV